MRRVNRLVNLLALAVVLLMTQIGTVRAGTDLDDACDILRDRIGWYTAASDVAEKWQVPVPTILAVMYQESRFIATAAAKTTTAYGFAQALDGTWERYRTETGAADAERTSFVASADFIGWYMAMTKENIGVPFDDVAGQYLAYHEGHAGYRSMRWKENAALIAASHDVARRAAGYQEQMRACEMPPMPTRVASLEGFPLPVAKPFALANVTPKLPRRKPIDALVAEANIPSVISTW